MPIKSRESAWRIQNVSPPPFFCRFLSYLARKFTILFPLWNLKTKFWSGSHFRFYGLVNMRSTANVIIYNKITGIEFSKCIFFFILQWILSELGQYIHRVTVSETRIQNLDVELVSGYESINKGPVREFGFFLLNISCSTFFGDSLR